MTVLEAYDEDVYKDVARIHVSHRQGVKRGGLMHISAPDGCATIVAVRGIERPKTDFIRLDFETRARLGVKLNCTYEFGLRPASWTEKLKWALDASDPALRVATWIAVLSAILGAIGFFMSVIQIFAV